MTSFTTSLDDAPATRLARAASGDAEAFTQIVRLHHDDMVRVAYLVCGDADVADEATQAAWAIAWQKLRTVRDADRLRPWLVSVAANEARRVLRGRSRRSVVELAVAIEAGGAAPDIAGRVPDLDLANALARLDPSDRALLGLRYVAGLNSFEVARATGRSASGTRARLARLLERLRKDLSDD